MKKFLSLMHMGRRAEEIFRDRHDYQVFITLLEEISEMWNIRVAGYCLQKRQFEAEVL